jgi:hypothetical protein
VFSRLDAHVRACVCACVCVQVNQVDVSNLAHDHVVAALRGGDVVVLEVLKLLLRSPPPLCLQQASLTCAPGRRRSRTISLPRVKFSWSATLTEALAWAL